MIFNTIAEIKEANRKTGSQFFSRGAVKGFKSRIHSSTPMKGRFFISSEQFGAKASDRRYCLRFAMANATIKKIGDNMGYYSKDGAKSLYNEFPDDIVKGLDFTFECGYHDLKRFDNHRKDESSELYNVCNFIYENAEVLNLNNILQLRRNNGE